MTGREPLRLVPPVTLVWDGAADVLQTATDAHREMDRLVRVEPPRRYCWYRDHPVVAAFTEQSRERKARRHNRFAVALLMVASVLIGAIFYAASAKADTLDELAGTVCHAIAAGGGTADTVLTIIGRGVDVGLTEQEAVDAIDLAVIAACPQYRGALSEYARVYGPVVA